MFKETLGYKILKQLKESELTIETLANNLESSESSVRTTVKRLKDKDLVADADGYSMNRYKLYKLTQKGIDIVSESNTNGKAREFILFLMEYFERHSAYLQENDADFLLENGTKFEEIVDFLDGDE